MLFKCEIDGTCLVLELSHNGKIIPIYLKFYQGDWHDKVGCIENEIINCFYDINLNNIVGNTKYLVSCSVFGTALTQVPSASIQLVLVLM